MSESNTRVILFEPWNKVLPTMVRVVANKIFFMVLKQETLDVRPRGALGSRIKGA